MSMRTPLGLVRGLGSAKEGTDHFWRQRLTAIANIPLLLSFVLLVVGLTSADYESVIEVLSSPFVAIIMVLVIVSALVHMRLGMQTIIEDYIHDEKMKLALLIGNMFFTVFIGFSCIFAILKISFGG